MSKNKSEIFFFSTRSPSWSLFCLSPLSDLVMWMEAESLISLCNDIVGRVGDWDNKKEGLKMLMKRNLLFSQFHYHGFLRYWKRRLDKSGAVLPLLSQFHYHFLLEGNDSSEREKEVIVKNKQTQAILEHSELTQKEPSSTNLDRPPSTKVSMPKREW